MSCSERGDDEQRHGDTRLAVRQLSIFAPLAPCASTAMSAWTRPRDPRRWAARGGGAAACHRERRDEDAAAARVHIHQGEPIAAGDRDRARSRSAPEPRRATCDHNSGHVAGDGDRRPRRAVSSLVRYSRSSRCGRRAAPRGRCCGSTAEFFGSQWRWRMLFMVPAGFVRQDHGAIARCVERPERKSYAASATESPRARAASDRPQPGRPTARPGPGSPHPVLARMRDTWVFTVASLMYLSPAMAAFVLPAAMPRRSRAPSP